MSPHSIPTKVFYLVGQLLKDSVVVPVTSVTHALVDSPSRVTKTNLGALRAQLADEAIIAFKEHTDDPLSCLLHGRLILEPHTCLKLWPDPHENKST